MASYSAAPRKLRTALTLSPGDWRIVAEAWLTLAWVRLRLGWLPYLHWREDLQQAAPRQCPPDPDWPAVTHTLRLFRLAVRNHLLPMNCLQRSLALQRLLDRRRAHAILRIGVRKLNGTLQAHAWLELAGRVINDAPDVAEQFAPFDLEHDEARSWASSLS